MPPPPPLIPLFPIIQRPPPIPTLLPYTTLFRSQPDLMIDEAGSGKCPLFGHPEVTTRSGCAAEPRRWRDRKSTRLNSSHRCISYAVFCLKKKKSRQGIAFGNQGSITMITQLLSI